MGRWRWRWYVACMNGWMENRHCALPPSLNNLAGNRNSTLTIRASLVFFSGEGKHTSIIITEQRLPAELPPDAESVKYTVLLKLTSKVSVSSAPPVAPGAVDGGTQLKVRESHKSWERSASNYAPPPFAAPPSLK